MVRFSTDQAFEFVKTFIEKAESFGEVRKMIMEHDFSDVLTPEENMHILDLWHKKCARELEDYQLISELQYWADDGTYKNHLDGFNAVRLDVLVLEAGNRNWMVKDIPSGVIISPPLGKPIVFKKAV